MDISVVIPAYNEAPNVALLYQELIKVLDKLGRSFEIIFIDDGSTDNTLEVLRELGRQDERIRVIHFRKNHGQSAAFDAGFKAACGEVVVTLDADLQNDPRDIPKLLDMLAEYDVVCGYRQKRQDPWLKRVSSKIANFVRNKLSQENIRDVGCSLKVYKRECLPKIKLYNGLHRFLPTLLKLEGFKVGEVKVNHFPRRFGQSKYNVRNRIFKAFGDLLVVRWMKKNQLTYEEDMEL